MMEMYSDRGGVSSGFTEREPKDLVVFDLFVVNAGVNVAAGNEDIAGPVGEARGE